MNRAAACQAEGLTASQPLKIDDLLTRLTSVAGEQDGSRKRRFSRPPAESFESTEATPSPITVADAEASSYHELIKSGGRPVCSIEDLSYLLTDPTAGYNTLSPWLHDHPDSKNEDGEIKTVFTRQFTRWWDFRKSQWDNRGRNDVNDGFPAFLEACRSKYDAMGAHKMTSSPSFEATMRRQWQHKLPSRQFEGPGSKAFPLYRDAVKRRLARHNFTRPLQLKKDPRQQTEWTNWLEYVGYEQWWLERRTAVAESLEEQTHEAWKKLLQARRPLSRATNGSHGIYATVRSAQTSQIRQGYPGGKTVHLGEELETTGKIIDDFIQETARYRRAFTAAYYQRLRVKWTVKEARLMETEISQQRKTAKRSTTIDVKDNKRRRVDDGEEEDKIPEPWSKRTRHGGGAKIAVFDSSRGNTRRSKRLAKGKTKV